MAFRTLSRGPSAARRLPTVLLSCWIAMACQSRPDDPQQPPAPPPGQVTIGHVTWSVDYAAALAVARQEHKPLWVHFGENPGWEGCQHFASGPLRDPRVVEASRDVVPVFVDTLDRDQPWERFGESWGSYPVLRVHDHDGRDLAGRLDGNPVRGRLPVDDVLAQLERGLAAWRR